MSAIKKDEIVILKERAARLAAEQERLESATVEIIGFAVPTNEREQEVIQLLAERMNLTEMLENVLNRIYSHERNENILSKAELNSLKEQKKSLFDQINALPDIGVTRSEWNELPEDFKKKAVGRPPVSLEQKIIRTRKEFEETMGRIAEIEGSADYEEIIQMSRDENVVEKRNGRPKHDTLGNLDTKLKNVRSKIEYITSGELERHVAKRLKDSIYSGNGKRLGRNFEDPKEKLARLRGEESAILAAITQMESKLVGEEKDARTIKTLRDRRNLLKGQIESCVSAEMARSLNAELETVLESLSTLEAKIRGNKAPTTKFRQLHAKEYEHVDIQGTVQSPAKIVQHIHNAGRTIEPSNVEEHHKELVGNDNDVALRRLEAIRATGETRETVNRLIKRTQS